jgi:hypothetical protein
LRVEKFKKEKEKTKVRGWYGEFVKVFIS